MNTQHTDHAACPPCAETAKKRTDNKEKKIAKKEKDLDNSLKDTFPASDPPSAHQITGTESP